MDKEKGATAPLKSKKSGKPGAKKKKQQMKTVENDQQDNAVYQELIEMAERFFIDQYHASIIEEENRKRKAKEDIEGSADDENVILHCDNCKIKRKFLQEVRRQEMNQLAKSHVKKANLK